MKNPFKADDLSRIRAAVAEAEGRTSGEIVPYMVERSGRYELAIWRGAVVLAVITLAVVVFAHQFYTGWSIAWPFTGWGAALLALIGGTLGALAAWLVAPLRRWLAGPSLLDRTVHQRALEAFVEEEVFATRERTGILLFISLFEHRIEVLGDSGINELVSADDWADVVLRVREGIRSGRVTEGVLEAIEMCGHLLERKGVELRPDDTDELGNEMRFKKGS
ncbi:MAG TPA: hypothetical protein VFG50_04175 [Rhodothermales bacterium]|nr:hypothetical protein [Rhodothermales bacterium]